METEPVTYCRRAARPGGSFWSESLWSGLLPGSVVLAFADSSGISIGRSASGLSYACPWFGGGGGEVWFCSCDCETSSCCATAFEAATDEKIKANIKTKKLGKSVFLRTFIIPSTQSGSPNCVFRNTRVRRCGERGGYTSSCLDA